MFYCPMLLYPQISKQDSDYKGNIYNKKKSKGKFYHLFPCNFIRWILYYSFQSKRLKDFQGFRTGQFEDRFNEFVHFDDEWIPIFPSVELYFHTQPILITPFFSIGNSRKSSAGSNEKRLRLKYFVWDIFFMGRH